MSNRYSIRQHGQLIHNQELPIDFKGQLQNKHDPAAGIPHQLGIPQCWKRVLEPNPYLALGRMVSNVQSSDIRLQAILDAAVDAVVCIDASGLVLEWNAASVEMFGWTKTEAIGQPLSNLMVRPSVCNVLLASLRDLRPANSNGERKEIVAVAKNGTELPIDLLIRPIQVGNRVLFSLTLRPSNLVTEYPTVVGGDVWDGSDVRSRLLQQTLQQSTMLGGASETFDDALLRCLKTMCEIADWSVGHVWFPDETGEAISCSKIWHFQSPGPESEIGSIDFEGLQNFLNELSLERSQELAGKIWDSGKSAWISNLSKEPSESPLRGCARFGVKGAFALPVVVHRETVAVLEFFSPSAIVPNHQLLLWAGTIENQLGRFLERRSWEAERQRLDSIVDSSHDAIIGKSLDNIILSWNAGAVEIYGYRADEVIGLPASIIIPNHLEQVEPELACVVRHGIRLNQFETVRRRKDGRNINVSMTVSPVHDAAGRIIGTSSIERDTTHRKRQEDELKQANLAAEAARRTKNEFLANVSHELRTPMNAIIGMVDLTLATDNLPPVAHEYLETASGSAHVLLSLLDDLLDFSRMESGHFELDSQPFSLRLTLDEAMRILSLRANERGIELLCDVGADVPDRLYGDARRLRQIVLNLAGNAIKFTEQGEVFVQVSIESLQDGNLQLLLSVRDTGIGIAVEDQERIFAPFTQADSSTTRRFTGTGLGLSICKELVERMNGRIWLESRLGRGTTFHCTPRFHVLSDATDREFEVGELQGLPILIVDDNATNREILEAILNGWSMHVDAAADGQTAVQMVEQANALGKPYRLLIVDGLMPEMDGFSLIEHLQARGSIEGATILMLSSGDRSTFDERFRGLPIDVHLKKPVSQSSLLESILAALNGPKYQRNVGSKFASTPQPLHILVAEDTVANQKVVRAILQRRGHQVDIAHNGREAIDMHERNSYDVILMDVQMPTMDGLQATSAIRSLRKPIAAVPIIAMTAHAMRGDRERCLAAGMDGYISKPIDAGELITQLENSTREHRVGREAHAGAAAALQMQMQQNQPEYIKQDSSEPVPAATQSVSARTFMSTPEIRSNLTQDSDPAAVNPLGEKPVLNLTSALGRLGGDKTLLRDLANFFIEDSAPLMIDLQEALNADDTERARRNAHSLKGLALNFSAEPCVIVAQMIEDLCKQRKLDHARQLFGTLQVKIQQVVEALRKDVLDQQPPTGSTSV